MKKKLIAGLVVFVAGFIAAFILMGYYNSWVEERNRVAELPESDIRPVTEVPVNGPLPGVAIEAFVDATNGYNLHLVTENFTFSPGLVGESSTPNTGYATVYINSKKQARMYNSWYHVGYEQLANGQNTVEVVLTGNDHTEWAREGTPIQDSVILEKVK